MSFQPTIKQLQRLLAENKLEEAVALLQLETWQLSDQQKAVIQSLSARLRQLRQQETRGIISHDNARLTQDQIKKQVQRILRSLDPTRIERVKHFWINILEKILR